MSNSTTIKASRGRAFVNFVLERIKTDSAFRAALSRADNPATESRSWEHLAAWCDLDKERERIPFAAIAAAVARAKPGHDGHLGIGRAVTSAYEQGRESDQARARLRRLLACDSVQEVCAVLRPLLSLIGSRGVRVSYGQLLDDLIYFGDGEKVKVRWAVDFYGRRSDDRDND